MTTGIVKDRRFLDHNAGAGHIENPGRLEAVHAMIEGGLPFSYVLIEPRPATREEVERVHTRAYIEALSRTAGKPFLMLDPDTSTTAKSYDTALLAAGGAIKAADMILAGDVQNGFALVRPPGHHAERGRAMGFCLINNVAVAAEHLLRARGLRKILIIDWDLHHGNGTQNAFYDRKDVLYFSTHQFPYYPGSGFWDEAGTGDGTGFTVNVPLAPGKNDDEYLFIFRSLLGPIAAAYRPEFVLVSAGFDIYRHDPLGGMRVTPEGFAALAAEITSLADKICQGRALFVLEGGYDPGGLSDGVKQVLLQMAGKGEPPSIKGEISAGIQKELDPVFKTQREFWPVKYHHLSSG